MIFPTLGRIEQAGRCLARFIETAPALSVAVVSHDRDAHTLATISPNIRVCDQVTDDVAEAMNIGLAFAPHHAYYMAGADDLWPSDGWFEAVEVVAQPDRLIGIPDGTSNREYATHFVAGRSFLTQYHGGVWAVPYYRSWFIDVEISLRARRAGRLWWADCMIEHRHYQYSKAANDETYARGRQWHIADQQVYERRMRANFPDDFKPII